MQLPARPITNSQLTVELETYLGELLFDHLRLGEEKDALIAQAVHDLRGPITNLKLYIYLLERADPEQQAKYIAVLKESVDSLVNMTEELMNQVRPADLPSNTPPKTTLQ
jgi:signal transduction histidine kinase